MAVIKNDMTSGETIRAHLDQTGRLLVTDAVSAQAVAIYDRLTDAQFAAAQKVAEEWGEPNPNWDMIAEIFAVMYLLPLTPHRTRWGMRRWPSHPSTSTI